MRKVKSARKLGRTAAHRRATLANLSTQLLLHKRIETTEAKAKEARKYVEKIITKAKDGTVHAQRIIFRKIRDKAAVRELFEDIVGKVADRNGGYTRVVKLAPRYGDAANMAVLELVDYTEAPVDSKKQTKQDRSKRVRGSKKVAKAAPVKNESATGEAVEAVEPEAAESVEKQAEAPAKKKAAATAEKTAASARKKGAAAAKKEAASSKKEKAAPAENETAASSEAEESAPEEK